MSKHLSGTADQDKLGPDTFSYFKREVIDLLSQEDNLPSPPHNSRISGVSSPFGDCLGPKLSHFKKEKLKTLLRQSVAILSKEVNEVYAKINGIQNFRLLSIWPRACYLHDNLRTIL